MTTRLLASLVRQTLAAQHARNVDLAVPPETQPDRSDFALWADGEKLRGIPATGKLTNAGAIRGTNPELEVCGPDA